MTIEEFMKKLEGVREDHPGQYSAKCPAHDDKTASLSVGKGRDNRIVVHCHAGCGHRDILGCQRRICSTIAGSLFAKPNRAGGKLWRDMITSTKTGRC